MAWVTLTFRFRVLVGTILEVLAGVAGLNDVIIEFSRCFTGGVGFSNFIVRRSDMEVELFIA